MIALALIAFFWWGGGGAGVDSLNKKKCCCCATWDCDCVTSFWGKAKKHVQAFCYSRYQLLLLLFAVCCCCWAIHLIPLYCPKSSLWVPNAVVQKSIGKEFFCHSAPFSLGCSNLNVVCIISCLCCFVFMVFCTVCLCIFCVLCCCDVFVLVVIYAVVCIVVVVYVDPEQCFKKVVLSSYISDILCSVLFKESK